jgi:septum formation topological specificity factor MinE
MDLVQYLRVDWPYEKTIEIIPSLTRDEFAVIERYYRVHKDELNAEDDRVEEYREEQLRIQRERIPMPDETSEERIAQLRALLKKRQQEANGDGSSR